MFKRELDLAEFRHSLFLFGPRQTGKTYLIQHSLSPDIFINLLDRRDYLRYAKDVSQLSQEVRGLRKNRGLVVIDEIQHLPELLNEVQLLMTDKPDFIFILTGSSARKLKRAGVNLLGGRAFVVHLYPLTWEEIGGAFSLDQSLRFGSLPAIRLAKDDKERSRGLRSYVETYLQEEIKAESLTRNIPAFAKFLELAAFENGNVINFQNIAREIGVHSKTVKDYFGILEDTLIGLFLPAFTGSHRKRIVLHPKFYFFDCGVVSALHGELSQGLVPGTPPYGRAFEHFIILEIKKKLDYLEREARMSYFRTSDGAEVDVILDFHKEIWAIEIKASKEPKPVELKGLKSFMKDHKFKRAICVCQTPRPYLADKIEFLPWTEFLKQL